jgi:replicative superfamily II helicase
MAEVIRISDSSTLVPTKNYPYASWAFDEFNPVQSRLMETYDGSSNVAIAAATSAGKAQPLYAPILTPKGFVPMGSIKVGDMVIAKNGNPTQVTGVFPQGKKRVYRVCFSDGVVAECCEDHLWSVRTRHDKCRNRPFRTKALKDLFGDLKLKDGQNKWFIPLIEPELRGDKAFGPNFFSELPLHPYVLGVLLGDGGIKYGVKMSSGDDFIIKQMELLLPEGVLIEFLENYDYQIIGGMDESVVGSGFRRTNLIKKVLSELGLFGLGSCDKFIPQMYLDADPASRLELLRGLMDTDGSANGVKAAEFTSCSVKLAQGVCQLARSLGASTCVRRGTAGYKDKEGNYIQCEDRHRVTVNIGSLNPFCLPRKAEAQNLNLEKGRNRSIDRIEVLGLQDCQCISVSSPDCLYVTSDYVLTHNTVCAEMYLAYEIRKRGGKGIYVGPLKALASEKEQDWTDDNHHFHDINTAIVTGDFRFTGSRISELDKSDLVVMTPEMLASRCRNKSSDKSKFLQDVGTIVFDESHLLTVPNRGDHIEVALMKMMDINPEVRIVLLSATMPNVDEICGWTSNLTGRDTYFLESDYRPCPLSIHYEAYYDGDKSYDAKEEQKVNSACSIVEYYPDDKFLIFVHTKRTGKLMIDELSRQGVVAEFHNADLGLKKRRELEDKFKNDPKFRVVVATSTLAWGLNLPARRVIVTGVHRGLTLVENYDIWQEVGRAGRPKYDPRGDAYILVPESSKDEHIARLKKKSPIRSTMLEYVGTDTNPHYKTLAFHVVSEIHHGSIKTKDGFHLWFRKSLAHHQDQDFNDAVVDRTIQMLEQCRAIVIEDGEYKCTAIGKVASMFYYSPFDVSDLRRNFKQVFEQKLEDNDYALAMAMGNVDTNKWAIANRYEKEEMATFIGKVERMFGENTFLPGALKYGFAFFNMMKGKRSEAFSALQATLSVDLERTMQVINAIDTMSCKWDKQAWFKTFKMRLQYGVEADLVDLVRIPNVGHVRANRLKDKKIKTLGDFLTYDAGTLSKIMKCSAKLAEEALEGARLIEIQDSVDV